MLGTRNSDRQLQTLNAQGQARGVARYVDEGLVGHWALDEGTGRDARDGTPHGHDGRLEKGTAWTAGVHGGSALSFDGKDDFVKISDDDHLDLVDHPFTFALWVQTTRLAAQGLAEKKQTFMLALNRAREVEGAFSVFTGSAWVDSDVRDIPDGAWHHLAVVYDGTRFDLYCDGLPAGGSQIASSYGNTKAELRFGRMDDFDGHGPFAGAVDDVRLYHRALSVYELEALVNPRFALRLQITRQPPAGALRLVILTLDGTPVTPQQLDKVDLLRSDSFGLPSNDWTIVPGRPVLNGKVGEWIEAESNLQPGRFYLLREP